MKMEGPEEKHFEMIKLENFKSNLDVIDKHNVRLKSVDKAVIYTGHTCLIKNEDKPFERNSPLLAAAVLGIDNTAIPILSKSKFVNIWTAHDAQEIFLDTKPTCYLILGKTGTDPFTLGETIAKKYNCVHLCPINIINDELEQNSPTGRTMDFNMRHNKACTFDTILKMLKIKLNSAAVQHRGYVISELPLVTCNRNLLYLTHSLNSEEAYQEIDELLFETICNLKKKKPKKPLDTSSSQSSQRTQLLGLEENEEEEENEMSSANNDNEDAEEEEDAAAELPKFILDPCSNVIINKKPYYETKQCVLLRQVQELFKLSLAPDIIIHITCPEKDLLTKKSRIYLNYETGQIIGEPFSKKVYTDLRWPCKYQIIDYENPPEPNKFNPKYNCRPPFNLKGMAIEQICNYKNYVFSWIEQKLSDFEPKIIIELDGRTSVHQMMHNVSERLLSLHIQPVVIPEPLTLEDLPEDLDEFWETVSQSNVIRSDVVNFNYYSSPWYNRCPVELKYRRSVIGNARYAVRFFKHVYLLFSLDNFVRFCRNPRPFLKLKYLEPTCRVIVTGTKCSGKSLISQCLSWIFDAPVICYKTFLQNEKHKKYETFAKTILTEIISGIKDRRFQEWQRAELDRITNLKTWCSFTLELLNKYLPLLVMYKEKLIRDAKQIAFQDKGEKLLEEEKEENDLDGEEVETHYDTKFLDDFHALEEQLSFLPFLDSVEKCEEAIADENILSQFAPIKLTTFVKKALLPVLGDEDVDIAINEYIVVNDLQKDVEPTPEEIMTEIVKVLSAIDTKTQEETNFEHSYGRYIIDGFPSNPEYWGYLTDPKLIPDYTIALIENREINQELYQYYTKVEQYTKYYEKTILLAKDPLTDTKLNSMTKTSLSELDIQIIVNYAINNALDFIFITSNANNNLTKTDSTIEEEGISTEQSIILFTEDIDKFREDWDSIKLKLEDNSKCFVETELENKTDVQVIEDVLLKIRQSYCYMGKINEGEEIADDNEDDESPKDLLNYNDPQFYCETNIYCPVAYYDYGILWKGNPEFSLKYQNKIHNFCNEEFLELFRKNITKYQSYNQPYKKLPMLKICVIGCFGSGSTSLSKLIAKDLGLLHIDFTDIINNYMMPRHYKNVGRSYEDLFSEELADDEAVVEFQMNEENENLLSDMLSNETEMRRTAINYFERGTPMPSILMQSMIKKIWFEPLTPTGFVLDGYPKLPNDVEDMMACFCIPDIVIELQSTSEVNVNRIGSKMFNTWKSQQIRAKQDARNDLDIKRKEWLHHITKQVVVKLIIEEILDNISDLEPNTKLSAESTIIDSHPSGPENVDPILFNTYNELVQEYLEPIDDKKWEKADEARERIETRIEDIYESDNENIEIIKETLQENRIKILSIDATKPLYKVFRNTLAKLIPLKNRCESLFEQTFIVKPDIAEILISQGFYFLSKFNRLCPVYLFENPETITNSYIISRGNGTVFPVIHRAYIYFLSSEDNVTKFRTNPLKYITFDILQSYFEYPLRLGIIGTPKSGKSSLAAKLAKRYGLLYLSRGTALRYVLENMSWTQMAIEMLKYLEDGNIIENDLIVKALQTVAVDYRTVTHGFVFDNFPSTPYEAQGLVKNGLYPNIIFDLSASRHKIIDNSQNEIYYDILKYIPPFPQSLFQFKYDMWRQRQRYKIRKWINDDYQNLYLLDGDISKWEVLSNATNELKQLTTKIHFYVSNVESNVVRAMWISNESFQERQTRYKNLCPVCFHQKVYRHSDYPVDKKGVVQYKNKFYWICETHLDLVMLYPHLYLADNDIEIPQLPARVKIVNPKYLHENGVCLVTYAENLPAQKIVRGTRDFAASYSGKAYLFCSEVCFKKFLTKPHLYYDITVFKEPIKFPKLCLKNLPNIGYLEQTLGNALTEACCSVNVVRPKYPGLSFELSALIYIALYLKANNLLMDPLKKARYLKALKVFQARCKLVLNVGLRLRSMDNPFAKHPICHHAEPTLRPVPTASKLICSSQIQRPSTLQQRSSNYVQMHKSSVNHPLQRDSISAADVAAGQLPKVFL